MVDWFCASLVGYIAIVPLYFLSLEHYRIQNWFGDKKGKIFGDFLGVVSGWVFFIFWMGLWVSPQPPLFEHARVLNSFLIFLYVINGFVLILAIWLGVSALRELSLKVSETHRPVKVIKTGVYGISRHPQYLAGVMGHLSLSFILQSKYSLLSTPIVLIVIYVIAIKEERELVREFGSEYEEYRANVPMFIPRMRLRVRFL
jgi:protein-S-isoprenylcysteine O-methyltransferase Ste14